MTSLRHKISAIVYTHLRRVLWGCTTQLGLDAIEVFSRGMWVVRAPHPPGIHTMQIIDRDVDGVYIRDINNPSSK